jgi:hypothetical protein
MGLLEERGRADVDSGAYSLEIGQAYVRGNYKYEATKPGKSCRVTVDLTTSRSLYCGWLVDSIKHSMEELDYQVQGVDCKFVRSPDPVTVGQSFKKMFNQSQALYFSDDVAFALRCADGMLWAELDISSCDSSNGPDIFGMLLKVTPSRCQHLMTKLMGQCQLPIRIGFGKNKIVAKPVSYFEYSGSLLTTLLNNLAVVMLLTHVLRAYDPSATRAQNRAALEAALSTASHKTTLVWCDSFYQMTFLMMNPCRDMSGEIRAILSHGVILRASGRTKEDFRGSGPLEDRVRDHMRCWVMGLRHSGNTPLLQAYERKFPPTRLSKPKIDSTPISRFTEHASSRVDLLLEDICTCYSITTVEYMELVSLLESSDVGVGIVCAASKAILLKDYGLRTPECVLSH